MRQLSRSRLEIIDALVLEGQNPLLNAALLEKDEHLTDALHALFGLRLDGMQLVLCGGTSLSKGYSIIERMSEDADLKIVLSESTSAESSSRLRTRLSAFKAEARTALREVGFSEDTDKAIARNGNRYIHTQWIYSKHYESAVGTRPNLQIEATVRMPLLPLESRRLTSLAGQLAPQIAVASFNAPVVSPAETMAEKVLSFLRRFAQHRSGNMDREWDTKLVRHIYDVHCLSTLAPELIRPAQGVFAPLVNQDIEEFGQQHHEFSTSPREVLSRALLESAVEPQTVREYEENLLPLVYGSVRPSFEEAFSSFRTVALGLVEML